MRFVSASPDWRRCKGRQPAWWMKRKAPAASCLPALRPACAATARTGDTIRVFGRAPRWGCELWRKGRLRRTVSAATPTPKRTHFYACNRTTKPILATMVYWAGFKGGWTAQGWFRLPKQRCAKLAVPRFYKYEVFLFGMQDKKRWQGKAAHFCVNPNGRFAIVKADRKRCPPKFQKVGMMKRNLKPGINTHEFRR